MRKHYLVTGGAGFIGSNLVEFLLNENHQVTVLDDLSTGFESNIAMFYSNNDFTFLKGSILNIDDCRNALKDVDCVIHMAALGSVPRSIDNPIATNDVNVNGFINIITATRDAGIKRFVYSTSSSIYGDDDSLKKIESRIGNPLSPYAVSKRTNELYAKVFQDLFDMEIIGLRYFNVFGPKQNVAGPYAAVIPIFIHNLLAGKPCTINGDGSITRDFTYVQNVVNANYLAATTSNKKVFGEVFNIAMGGTITLIELYEAIEAIIQSGLTPLYKEPRKGDILKSLANVEKAKSLLNFQPTTELNEALTYTIDWYKQKIS